MIPFRNLLKLNISKIILQDTRQYARDAGIRRRKTALNLTADEIESLEDFDKFETDFMAAQDSYNEHISEMDAKREKLKLDIVRQKYFKESSPNFLTWHDKEQIRYLYRTNPDEWTIEQLSESFPALPETIKKIAKSNWVKQNQNKIDNHDKAVRNNWDLFKSGKLSNKLPPNLENHLKKFTSRNLVFQPFVALDNQKIKSININCSEFSEIITSYENLKSKNTNSSESKDSQTSKKKHVADPPSSDTYLVSKLNDKEQVTLERLKDKIKDKVKSGEANMEDRIVLQTLKEKEETHNNAVIESYNTVDLNVAKYENEKSIGNYVKKYDVKHLTYPEKISIPKNLVNRDKVYKLNDCYYDYDGQFLYRVPGMG